MFRSKVKVKRTIFPYPDGWGVVIERPFKPMTVIDVGLTKEEAEHRARELRKSR